MMRGQGFGRLGVHGERQGGARPPLPPCRTAPAPPFPPWTAPPTSPLPPHPPAGPHLKPHPYPPNSLQGRTCSLRKKLRDLAEFVFVDAPHLLPLYYKPEEGSTQPEEGSTSRPAGCLSTGGRRAQARGKHRARGSQGGRAGGAGGGGHGAEARAGGSAGSGGGGGHGAEARAESRAGLGAGGGGRGARGRG